MQDQQPLPRALGARAGFRPGSELYSAGARARICRPERAASLGLPGFCLAAIAAALGCAAWTSRARGQAEPVAPSAQGPAVPEAAATRVQAAAQAHFDAAMQHYKGRRYREAIREFEQSAAAVPNAELWFDIGRAHEQLGEYGLAIESYRRYLRDRVDAPDADELSRHIDALAQRGQTAGARDEAGARSLRGALAVDASQPGALVLLDGKKLGIAPIDRVLDVEPGSHRIDATRAGYVPFRAQVDVQEGALSAAYVGMQPLRRVQDAPRAHGLVWVAAGLSAAALLTGAAFRLAAVGADDDGQVRAADRWALAADVAFAAAFTSAVSAALAYMLERRSPVAETHSSHLRTRADRLTLLKQR